jgi:nucleotide-binding universal stress UspA family protein
MLVRPREPAPELTAPPMLSKILIPLDGSELAEQILGPAVKLGRLTDAELRLLRVVEPVVVPDAGYDGTLLDRLEAEARSYLARVEERLRRQSLRVQTRVIVGCPAAAAILDVASAEGADLIALETHGRGGLGRLLLGSVADKLVRGATVPVLVHHPGSRKEGKS